MRNLAPLALMVFALCSCKKPVPEAELAAMEAAVNSCVKCLDLTPDKAGPCAGKARTDYQAAFAKIRKEEDGIDGYEETSKARVIALQKALSECGSGIGR